AGVVALEAVDAHDLGAEVGGGLDAEAAERGLEVEAGGEAGRAHGLEGAARVGRGVDRERARGGGGRHDVDPAAPAFRPGFAAASGGGAVAPGGAPSLPAAGRHE